MRNDFLSLAQKRFKTRVLENGLKVVAYRDTSSPEVLMQVAYNVGSAHETSLTRGMAHLVEHMIFKGTDKLSETDIDAVARKFGAQYNAFTFQDNTCFYFEVDSSNWKQILPILADCMSNARFDEQHLASEIKTVISELNMYKDDQSSVIFETACARAFPADHPYHFPIIGFLTNLAQLNSKDLFTFYKQNYSANNATLYIAGDIDLEEALDFAQETFGSLVKNPSVNSTVVIPRFTKPLLTTETTLWTDISAPMTTMFWPLPGMAQPLLEECAGAVNTTFSRGLASRLYKKLINQKGLATDVAGVVHSMSQGGIYLINVTCTDEKNLAKSREIIKKELRSVKIKSTELQKFIAKELFDFYQALESTQEVVNKLIFSHFRTIEETFDYQSRLHSLTTEQIEQFVEQYFNPDLAHCINVLPFKDLAQRELWQENTKKEHEQEAMVLERFKRTSELEAPKYLHTLSPAKDIALNFVQPDKVVTLENGIEVVFKKRLAVPVVHLSMGFHNDEFLAHSKEGLLFNFATSLLVEENQTLSQTQIFDVFERVGADFSFNKTAFYLAGKSDSFLKIFKHFLQIITQPKFSQEPVDKVCQLIVDGIKRESDDMNSVSFRESFNRIFKDTQFQWTFEQAMDLVQNATPELLKDVYFKNFCSQNLVFVIVGDINEQLVATVTELLGSIKTESCSSTSSIKFIESKNYPLDTIEIPMSKDQCLLTLVRRSNFNIKSELIPQIALLNMIVFKSLGSRLYALRERYGLFYAASGGFASDLEILNGVDKIKLLTARDKVPLVLDLVKEMFEELAQTGVTEAELAQAKQLCQKQLLENYSSNGGMAETFLNLRTKGLPFDFHESFYKKITQVRTDTINALCKKLCNEKDSFLKITVGAV